MKKKLTATLILSIEAENAHDTELQSLVQAAIDSAVEGIETAPGDTTNFEVSLDMNYGEITESRPFKLGGDDDQI